MVIFSTFLVYLLTVQHNCLVLRPDINIFFLLLDAEFRIDKNFMSVTFQEKYSVAPKSVEKYCTYVLFFCFGVDNHCPGYLRVNNHCPFNDWSMCGYVRCLLT